MPYSVWNWLLVFIFISNCARQNRNLDNTPQSTSSPAEQSENNENLDVLFTQEPSTIKLYILEPSALQLGPEDSVKYMQGEVPTLSLKTAARLLAGAFGDMVSSFGSGARHVASSLPSSAASAPTSTRAGARLPATRSLDDADGALEAATQKPPLQTSTPSRPQVVDTIDAPTPPVKPSTQTPPMEAPVAPEPVKIHVTGTTVLLESPKGTLSLEPTPIKSPTEVDLQPGTPGVIIDRKDGPLALAKEGDKLGPTIRVTKAVPTADGVALRVDSTLTIPLRDFINNSRTFLLNKYLTAFHPTEAFPVGPPRKLYAYDFDNNLSKSETEALGIWKKSDAMCPRKQCTADDWKKFTPDQLETIFGARASQMTEGAVTTAKPKILATVMTALKDNQYVAIVTNNSDGDMIRAFLRYHVSDDLRPQIDRIPIVARHSVNSPLWVRLPIGAGKSFHIAAAVDYLTQYGPVSRVVLSDDLATNLKIVQSQNRATFTTRSVQTGGNKVPPAGDDETAYREIMEELEELKTPRQ